MLMRNRFLLIVFLVSTLGGLAQDDTEISRLSNEISINESEIDILRSVIEDIKLGVIIQDLKAEGVLIGTTEHEMKPGKCYRFRCFPVLGAGI